MTQNPRTTNVPEAESSSSNVTPLCEMKDVRLHDAPDVRGWRVRSSDGREIGRVDRLFMDRSAHELRYLDVKIDPEAVGPDFTAAWDVLVPVGRARIDPRDDVVLLPTLNSSSLREMPKLPHDQPSREFEVALIRWFGGAPSSEKAMYQGEVFDLKFLTADRQAASSKKAPKGEPAKH
jgi:PRC-barrel domain